MKNLEEIKKAIRFMCINLVGETIKINWRRPILFGFSGQAYLDGQHVINFDIDPEQTMEGIYRTAVHEAAHCLAGHLKKVSPRDLSLEMENLYSKKGPLLERTVKEEEEYQQSPEEAEARDLAGELDRVARSRSLAAFGNDDVENKIAVLSQILIVRSEDKSHE